MCQTCTDGKHDTRARKINCRYAYLIIDIRQSKVIRTEKYYRRIIYVDVTLSSFLPNVYLIFPKEIATANPAPHPVQSTITLARIKETDNANYESTVYRSKRTASKPESKSNPDSCTGSPDA